MPNPLPNFPPCSLAFETQLLFATGTYWPPQRSFVVDAVQLQDAVWRDPRLAVVVSGRVASPPHYSTDSIYFATLPAGVVSRAISLVHRAVPRRCAKLVRLEEWLRPVQPNFDVRNLACDETRAFCVSTQSSLISLDCSLQSSVVTYAQSLMQHQKAALLRLLLFREIIPRKPQHRGGLK